MNSKLHTRTNRGEGDAPGNEGHAGRVRVHLYGSRGGINVEMCAPFGLLRWGSGRKRTLPGQWECCPVGFHERLLPPHHSFPHASLPRESKGKKGA